MLLLLQDLVNHLHSPPSSSRLLFIPHQHQWSATDLPIPTLVARPIRVVDPTITSRTRKASFSLTMMLNPTMTSLLPPPQPPLPHSDLRLHHLHLQIQFKQ